MKEEKSKDKSGTGKTEERKGRGGIRRGDLGRGIGKKEKKRGERGRMAG